MNEMEKPPVAAPAIDDEIEALESVIRSMEQQHLELLEQQIEDLPEDLAAKSATEKSVTPAQQEQPPASAWAARYAQMLRQRQLEEEAHNQAPRRQGYRRCREFTPFVPTDPSRPLRDYFPRRRR